MEDCNSRMQGVNSAYIIVPCSSSLCSVLLAASLDSRGSGGRFHKTANEATARYNTIEDTQPTESVLILSLSSAGKCS